MMYMNIVVDLQLLPISSRFSNNFDIYIFDHFSSFLQIEFCPLIHITIITLENVFIVEVYIWKKPRCYFFSGVTTLSWLLLYKSQIFSSSCRFQKCYFSHCYAYFCQKCKCSCMLSCSDLFNFLWRLANTKP